MKKAVRLLVLLVVILAVCGAPAFTRAVSDVEERKVAFVPSVIGNPFFTQEARGFEEAFDETDIDFIYLGPESGTPEETIEIINNLMIQNVDAINFVPTDPEALNTLSRQAMRDGIIMVENGSPNMLGNVHLSTTIFTPDPLGELLIKAAAELINYSGEIAILSAAATSTAQNEWIAGMKKALEKPEYADLDLIGIAYGDDLREKSYNETIGLLRANPNLRCIIAPTTVGIAAAARAVTDEGLIGEVIVSGLGLPSEMAEYIRNGAAPRVSLWNPIDLGYFNAKIMMHLMDGTITGDVGETFSAGRLGDYTIEEDGIVTFQQIQHFDEDNIDVWEDRF